MPRFDSRCIQDGVLRLQRENVGFVLGNFRPRKFGDFADVLATANPGCALQIANGLRESGSKTQVRYVVELLAEAYSQRT